MIKQPNMAIRKTCKIYGVPLWRLAQQLSISEGTFIRRLRVELSESDKEKLLNLISEISEKPQLSGNEKR